MAPPRTNITQAMTVVLAALKRKGKTNEAPEPADHWPNLSDVHISNTSDSHSNTALPRGTQAAEPEHWPGGEQVLQMLFTLRKQMEDQQTEMIRLREVVAH